MAQKCDLFLWRHHISHLLPGIGKILFERIAFPIHIPSAEVDCIPTRNPLFSLGLWSNPQSFFAILLYYYVH